MKSLPVQPLWLFVCAVVLVNSKLAAEVPVGRFVDPRPVYDDDVEVFLGSVSDDGLNLYFASRFNGSKGGFDLFQATRTSTDELFSNVLSLGDAINTSSNDRGGKISPNGLSLHFLSDKPDGFGDLDMYVATRPQLGELFGNVKNLGPGVNTTSLEGGAQLSRDELTIYFQSNRSGSIGDNRDLYQATRATPEDEFGNVVSLGPEVNSIYEDSFPTISGDELTLFFNSTTRPTTNAFSTNGWVAHRDDRNDSFGAAITIDDFSLGSELTGPDIMFHPYISSDWPATGSKLYYNRAIRVGDFDIYEATWTSESSAGDLTGDGHIDIRDVDFLASAIRRMSSAVGFDLDGSGEAGERDLIHMVEELLNTWVGDANLDGEFNSTDLVAVFTAGEYEDGIDRSSGWAEGDWNGDAEFDSGDLVVAFQDGGYELGPRVAANAVPEPASFMMLMAGLIGMAMRRRHVGH